METPNTRAGRLTEEIMAVFWRGNKPLCVPKLETEAYNRVYEHVLRTLEIALGTKPLG